VIANGDMRLRLFCRSYSHLEDIPAATMITISRWARRKGTGLSYGGRAFDGVGAIGRCGGGTVGALALIR
jgi:hypothetical protein